MENEIGDLYADISACLLAMSNALVAKGLLSKEEICEAAQERLLALQPSGIPDAESPHPFVALRSMATAWKSTPPQ